MSNRYSWVIRAGYENGDEKEISQFNDMELVQEAFVKFDLETDGKAYDWAEFVKIDWYKRSENVVDEIVKQTNEQVKRTKIKRRLKIKGVKYDEQNYNDFGEAYGGDELLHRQSG